ncbi:hypothetical protein SBBP2_1550018 [Burkholderiales bacterium]|nr:hypothetical protein SBBP2_1550018 [Burkholderiales bacterium]
MVVQTRPTFGSLGRPPRPSLIVFIETFWQLPLKEQISCLAKDEREGHAILCLIARDLAQPGVLRMSDFRQ